jgi:predicted nucleotidyltransferase
MQPGSTSSKARGNSDAESDLDLLVLLDAGAEQLRTRLWQIASDVSLDYNVVLSVRVFDQVRWGELQQLRLPLYRSIMADGIPLTSEKIPG